MFSFQYFYYFLGCLCYFVLMDDLPAHIKQRPEAAIRFPETGVINAIESPYGIKSIPLEGWPVLLTTEPYPQALVFMH